MTRRTFLASAATAAAGCGRVCEKPELVWGKRGVVAGDFVRPRAVTLLAGDTLYVVDFTARIQAYDADGRYRGVTWQTPDYRNGRPSGLATTRDGNIIVCDSHYHTLRVYTPNGRELFTRGGTAGPALGEFGYVSDAVEAPDGTWFVSEFGANERITQLDPAGRAVLTFGQRGSAPGEFNHIRALALGPDQLLYAADAGNHRVQVFDAVGSLVRIIGRHGASPGQFAYPYDLTFGPRGDLYVVEFENHRVQKLSATGEPRTRWGGPGRLPGRLYSPWALAVDSRDRVHVIDTENHRVQRIRI
jgi:DNA-binding beta-propeller fold protein YncE